MEAKESSLSFFDSVQLLFKSLQAYVSKTCHLAFLELQLAGKSLLFIIVLFFTCALLFITAWFCLLAAFISWLVISFHMPIPLAILTVALINLLAIPLLFLLINQLSQHLKFKHTRKQLHLYESHHGKTQQTSTTN